MKNIVFQMSFVGFLLCFFFSKAQFNTLTPMIPVKVVSEKKQNVQLEKVDSEKNIKNPKFRLNFTSKNQLKNEIDSLKTLLKEYRNLNERKVSILTQIQDSLLGRVLKEQIENKTLLVDSNAFNKDESTEKLPKIMMPLKNKMTITSSFGNRVHPIFGTKKMHNGIDLQASYENIYAVMDGVVSATGWDSKGGGNYIKIKHFNRFETSYLHLSEVYYQVGEKVKAGFIIGKSGNSGNSTGPHLHFSVKEYGKIINPNHFLNDLTKANQLITFHNE